MVAAALVITAAVVVIGAVLSASVTLVSVAAVLAVVLGATAVRITHSELVQSRRDAAADRAEQAQAYRTIAEARSREQREFVDAMGDKVGRAASSARRLRDETRRADEAEAEGSRLAVALEESEERAAEAIVRVAELEDENGILRTENDTLRSELDIATSWPAAGTA